ncbi:MAG: transglutaminase-like domain-containing protein, partial [Acidimicrobiales bacterium]
PGDPAPLAPGRLDVAGAEEKPGRDLVLRVEAPGPDVWRLGTYDLWDGRGWDRSPVAPPPAASSWSGDTVFAPFVPSEPADQAFRQRVTVEADIATALVAAPRAAWFEMPGGGGRADADGWLLPPAPLGRGATYVVESRRGPPAAGALVAEPPDGYRTRPDTSSRVAKLATTLTAPAVDDQGRARALERWLDENIRVVDSAPALPPGDVVEMVLFGDRTATPDRLATVLAVMLRTLDIPARVGVGFLPGRRALLGGDFEVRQSDAHTWAEAWSPGAGWQRYDPSGRIASALAADSLLTRLGRLLAALWLVLVALVVAVVAWLTWRAAERRRRRRALPWATRYFDRLVLAGTKVGRPRRPEETAAEYARALAGASVLADPRLADVGTMVTRAAHSDWSPSREDLEWAETVLREAQGHVPSK